MSTWMVGYILITMALGCLALGLSVFVIVPQPTSKPLRSASQGLNNANGLSQLRCPA